MPPELRWRLVECFLLAGIMDDDGKLPAIADAAWILRIALDELVLVWNDLVARNFLATQEGFVEPNEAGFYVVRNYSKRQAAMSDTKRWREWKKRQDGGRLSNKQQTNSKRTTNESFVDKAPAVREEREERGNRLPAVCESFANDKQTERLDNPGKPQDETALVYQAYEQEIGPLTPALADEAGDWVDSYPQGWAVDAIKIAAKRNHRKASYVAGILRSWYIDGRDDAASKTPTIEDLDAELERRGYGAS